MEKRRRAACVLVAALVGAAFAGIAVGGATAGARTTGRTADASFTDPAGDAANNGPDIQSASLSDDANGTVRITVAVGMQANTEVDVYLNTDKNTQTGSPSGSEYEVQTWRDENNQVAWNALRWSGGKWQDAPESPTLSFNRSGDVYTWLLGSQDIGGATGFTFFVASVGLDASGNPFVADTAPDDGTWVYDTAAAQAAPTIGTPHSVPASPRPGQAIAISFPVTNGATVSSKVVLGGHLLAHADSVSGGAGRVRFTVPANAKGKFLTITLTAKLGSKSTVRVVAFRIR